MAWRRMWQLRLTSERTTRRSRCYRHCHDEITAAAAMTRKPTFGLESTTIYGRRKFLMPPPIGGLTKCVCHCRPSLRIRKDEVIQPGQLLALHCFASLDCAMTSRRRPEGLPPGGDRSASIECTQRVLNPARSHRSDFLATNVSAIDGGFRQYLDADDEEIAADD
jgi:hypothetical protein